MILCIKVRCKGKPSTRLEINNDSIEKSKESQQSDSNTRMKMGIGNDLLFCLSLTVLLYSSTTFLKLSDFDQLDTNCLIQGFCSNILETSITAWVLSISYNNYISTKVTLFSQIESKRTYYLLYSVLIPTVLGLLPLASHSYGPSGAWCWIAFNTNAFWPTFWAYFFYAYSILNYIAVVYLVLQTHRYFWVRYNDIKERLNTKKEVDFLRKFLVIIWVIPCILFLNKIAGFFNRGYETVLGRQSSVLFCMQGVLTTLQGFFLCIVYMYFFRKVIVNYLCCCFVCKKPRRKSLRIDLLNEEV